MKNRFEVSTEGMRELQSGREPWQLAKELISNAWDEKTTTCRVQLKALTTRTAYLSVYDDGKGFKDIADAWTLMKHTDKRLNPEVRGRFNIGEKEILSVAQEAKITTSGKVIIFPKEGGRQVRRSNKPSSGTLVEVWLLWGSNQVKETIDKLGQLLPPKGIAYTVNNLPISPQTPHKTTEAILETIIQPNIGEPMKSSRRKTAVEIYRNANQHRSILYEMGIPVQEIDCPYSVNIMQKIPLPPNRDTVEASYLQDVYAVVLNATADEVMDAAANWTRMAIEDKEATPEAVRTIITKRYGDKVALWSSETKSNERAMLAGYEIVNARTLSSREREVFGDIGIQHTSDIYPVNYKPARSLDESELTEGMKQVRQYARQLHNGLFNKDIHVDFYNDFKIGEAASYGAGQLTFNIGRLGKAWFNTIDEGTTSLLLHEFAHTEGVGHEPSYYRSLQKLAGKAVHLALSQPDIFKVVAQQ